MAVVDILQEFRDKATQCDSLIGNAHRQDANGAFLFPPIDRKQITVAAFLNLFVAWEEFLEESLAELMVGSATMNGNQPVKYVSPIDTRAAKEMVVGPMRYFEYGNPEYFRKITNLYFQNAYPYEPHISAIASDLQDIRTMRNASAHMSSTTQTVLEGLAQRIFAVPKPSIDLYAMLTAIDPRDASGTVTVFQTCRGKLIATAELIANG